MAMATAQLAAYVCCLIVGLETELCWHDIEPDVTAAEMAIM